MISPARPGVLPVIVAATFGGNPSRPKAGAERCAVCTLKGLATDFQLPDMALRLTSHSRADALFSLSPTPR
jgi:hypothetical protein